MAYAAIVSLAQLLKQLLKSDQLPLHYPKPQLQSLHKNVSSLQSSLEKFVFVPKNRREDLKELEVQIRDVIYKAQDAIDSFVKQSKNEEVPEEQTISPSTFLQELQEIIEKIGPVTKETEEISDLIRKETGNSLSEDTWSTKSTFSTKIKIVGQDKDRKLVIDELMSDTSQRQIIPIIGMPGIGKTTLARSVYEHQEIENHFNIRAWVTVSSDFNVRDIFLKLLSSMVSKGQKSDDSGSMKNLGEIVNQERADLALSIYQKLYNTRYLVVIDDMWHTGVWDGLNSHFPDNKNGSRIILTTRDGEIADYIVSPTEFRRVMEPLGLEDSWTLLCIKAFEEGDSEAQCPPNLEKPGRRIAENCQGLPLSLTVVGGLLSQKRTEEYWKIVEDDTKAAAAKSEEAYLEILSLSYNHLPNRLKGCFLYMGAFPEDSEILVSKLIKLWVAEGILAPPPPSTSRSMELVDESVLTPQPPPSPKGLEQVVEGISTPASSPPESSEQVAKDSSTTPLPPSSPKSLEKAVEGVPTPQPPSLPKSLEKVAQQYLVDLVSRNLISVRRNTSDGHIKTCGIHDVIRALAMDESKNVKFFHSINKYVSTLPPETHCRRRLSVHKNILLCVEEVYNSAKSLTLARTLLCAGPHHHHPIPYSLSFDLLRVLDALSVYFIEFPDEIINLIHLRYLSFTYNGKLPSSLSKLENLQVLILRQYPKIIFIGTSILPDEIWNMRQLRHLLFTETELPLMPSGLEIDAQNSVLLVNLQTLTSVNASCCTKEVLQNIPNLKKLGIWVESPGEVNFYLDVLEQLESLTFTVLNPDPDAEIKFLPEFSLPMTLRKLSLSGCGIPWEKMAVVAQLPHLQVLKLRELAFRGKYWIMDGMIFQELKLLLLEYMDFQSWGTDDYDEARCFPSLKRLMIQHCYELEEVPEDLGNIGGLELLELVDCSPSAVESAKKIRENQKDYKNDFQVRIYSSWE